MSLVSLKIEKHIKGHKIEKQLNTDKNHKVYHDTGVSVSKRYHG